MVNLYFNSLYVSLLIKNKFLLLKIENFIQKQHKNDLREIEFVDIYCKNPVIISKQIYYLYLSPKVVAMMIQSYDGSLTRKRPTLS